VRRFPAKQRRLLTPLNAIYGAGITARNCLFDRGILEIVRAECPVVSVGNLTVGGTGKTPFTQEVCRRLQRMGARPAILMRGYRARGDVVPVQPWCDAVPEGGLERWGDEALAHARALSDVPVYALPDRRKAARIALDAGATVLVLDDGFQHRRLHRDLDIVCLDSSHPLGRGGLLPGGDLRESPSGLRRADLLVRTRWKPDLSPGDGEETIQRWAANVPQVYCAFEPGELRVAGGSGLGSPQRVVSMAGIVDPNGFAQMLKSVGLEVVESHSFADHHHYSFADMKRLRDALRRSGADAVVTTAKDEGRILATAEGRELAGEGLLYVLELRLEVSDEEGSLTRALESLPTP